MKKSSIIIQIILVLILFSSFAFAQSLPELEKVKEIKLLESTRDDVLKILSTYEVDAEVEFHRDTFSTKDAEITINYSEGNCKESVDDFKVDEWKVIYILLELKNS